MFVGKGNSHFAILANSGDKVDVFAMPSPAAPGSKASKKLDAAPRPMRTLNLPSFSIVFAGPAWGSLPKWVSANIAGMPCLFAAMRRDGLSPIACFVCVGCKPSIPILCDMLAEAGHSLGVIY